MIKSSNEVLAEVASLYYESGHSQEEIAQRMGVSRSSISRLLNDARREGIVEIRIHYPWKTSCELQDRLVERFGLQQAFVLAGNGKPYDQVLKGIGVLAARHLEEVLQDGIVVGISWGTAIHATVQALRPSRHLSIQVAQMIGAAGVTNPLIDGPELAHFLADICGGQYYYLHAPLIVENELMRDALLRDPSIRQTLDLARQAKIAVVGIGTVEPELSSLLRAGYLSLDQLTAIREQGAMGDICARHFDILGQELDIELNRCVVGVELETLHGIEQVIGVAGGEAKAKAILGALRGGHVNVLVTDDGAAGKVLAFDRTR